MGPLQVTHTRTHILAHTHSNPHVRAGVGSSERAFHQSASTANASRAGEAVGAADRMGSGYQDTTGEGEGQAGEIVKHFIN